MDVPNPPEDLELRNIIDKFAQFVARNGPQFEQMTKEKQAGNPRFNFLFGGEYYNYYQYRVANEQVLLKGPEFSQNNSQPPLQLPIPPGNSFYPPPRLPISSQSNQSFPPFLPTNLKFPQNDNSNESSYVKNNLTHHSSPALKPQMHSAFPVSTNLPQTPPSFNTWRPPFPQPSPPVNINDPGNNPNTETIQMEISDLENQIKTSKENLEAQEKVIMEEEKNKKLEQLLIKLQDDELKRMCEDYNINLNEFDKVLQPIITSCRKESIANGKVWIFNNCYIDEHFEAVAKHLLKRVTRNDSDFEAKLHLMYLINDIFNHCMRKGDGKLKNAISQIIVPAFSTTVLEADDDKKQKMNKLLKLWEMNQYLDQSLLDQLKKPDESIDAYKTSLNDRYSEQIQTIVSEQSEKYDVMIKQHDNFVLHCQNKIKDLQQKLSYQPPTHSAIPIHHPPFPPAAKANMFIGVPPQVPGQLAPPPPMPQLMQPNSSVYSPQPNFIPNQAQSPTQTPQRMLFPRLPFLPMPAQQQSPYPANFYQNTPQPLYQATSMPLISQPGAPTPIQSIQPNIEEIKPPYFDLPAGIMTQLIKLEDFDYLPIDPDDIRMPLIAPPSERLLQALEAFYAPPSHEHPRNADGWEKLGLYEFFKAKSQARKEYDMKFDGKEKSNDSQDSNESLLENKSKKSNNNSSGNNSFKKTEDRKSVSPPKKHYKKFKEKRSRSRSRSRERYKSTRSRSSSRSYSRSRSKSPPPKSRYSPKIAKTIYKRKSRSRSRSPTKKYSNSPKNNFSNKGFSPKAVGFSGPNRLKQDFFQHTNKSDNYPGIGTTPIAQPTNDPFESFRRNKGQAYIQRIKEGRRD